MPEEEEEEVILSSDEEGGGQREKAFARAKESALGKRDKSGAGAIDPRAVSVCAAINSNPAWYTTSSCAGRCFVWRGVGGKATEEFARGRVSHELIDLAYLTGDKPEEADGFRSAPLGGESGVWLRYEPFIVHVRCRTGRAARKLVRCARSVFKNVGLQGDVVAVVGDEGLEMPLVAPSGASLAADAAWLVEVVNEKHQRNWAKIERFERAILAEPRDERTPRFDVIGDVAVARTDDSADRVLASNKKIRVVAVAAERLHGDERAPAAPLRIVAGARRSPLVTTHVEAGVRIIVDLDATFFSPRMALERTRICKSVKPGERVLSLFAGCGPEALGIAARTRCASVRAVELAPVAARCCRRGLDALRRAAPDRAAVLTVVEADVLEDLATLRAEQRRFDRILAPRPKHPVDGDVADGRGRDVLDALFHVADPAGAVVHWTDFAADWELPTCARTRAFLAHACADHELECDVLYSGRAGPSVAKRQKKDAE
ncbi:hypothetical protein CTAYLR_005345 [Chrysophaeum taylorii]|uniref:tRNA(Phe) 7-[(3-amino-3-carboxypropyl)-4-demethylwyosine(37)-N(4)]-methyltransferase n=1 Tax=Chrysophaeum taylorii TaxID=2483200 RepID=A0AAD7U6T3_9STRA|nr:hypothetical protein CTAYLR_005345 [Chrysophaeum taylorii]